MLRALLLALVFVTAGLPALAVPTDEMFEKLKTAPSESEANDAAQDIWASWMESGSAGRAYSCPKKTSPKRCAT